MIDLSRGGLGVTEKGRKGDWMQTWTGKRFYPLDPRPEDIDLLDVAFALGNLSRYCGHCTFYSVAEHSVLVSQLVPEHLALQGLLHDAVEAYLSDLVRPVKRALGDDNSYFMLDSSIWRLGVAPRFKLPEELDPAVKRADVAILGLERERLHPRASNWMLPFSIPNHLTLDCLPPELAQLRFIERYCEVSRASPEVLCDLTQRYRTLKAQDQLSLRPLQQDQLEIFP